jgi:putative membrane protein
MDPDQNPFAHHGPYGFGGGFPVLPFLGSAVLLLLVLTALTLFYLHRQGRLTLPGLGGRRPPEEEAKAILAERFARGDISTEDFMERSSILNWTPGSEAVPARRRPRRR